MTSPGADPKKAAPGSPAAPVTPAPVPGAPQSGPRSEIRLGSVGTDSGPLGQIMLPYLQGARIWAADVNARGGLAGHPVRLIFADDGADPNKALALAKRMVDTDKVQAFFAVRAPTTLQAITPYLEQKRIPAIASCPCNAVADSSPMNFSPQTGGTFGLAWEHLAPVVALTKERRIAQLYCREASICDTADTYIKKIAPAAGVEVVYRGQVSIAQPDYTAEVIQARNSGANVIVAIMDNASALRILRSAHRQNYHPVIAIQRTGYDERFLRQGGEDIDGVVTASTTVPWSTSPLMADFRAAMDRLAPGMEKSTQHAEIWAAGKLLELLAKSFPADPGPADVLAGLYGLRNETVGGLLPPLAFARDGGHGATNQCVIPVQVNNKGFVPASQDQFVCAPGWKPVAGS